MTIDLTIIILNYNTKELLDHCLASIFNNKTEITTEIIMVDNKSTDGSAEMVAQKYPGVKVIRNNENLGYSKGNNIGIKKAGGRNILLLNSDTELIGNGAQTMVKLLDQNSNIGIVGPKLVFPDKSPQASVGVFYNLPVAILYLLGLERLGFFKSSPSVLKKVNWVMGACFLFKKELTEKIGILDENLFMYMEEVEFCYRAKLNGYETYFTPEATVVHKERAGNPNNKTGAVINIYKGLMYFYKKYYPEFDLVILKTVLKIKAGILTIFGRLINNSYLSETYGKAFELVK